MADDPVITVTIGETGYSLRIGDCTAVDASACRRATGKSIRGLLAEANDDPDIDVIAAVVWLSRRTHGERDLDFVTVAEGINYDSKIVADATDDEGDESLGE